MKRKICLSVILVVVVVVMSFSLFACDEQTESFGTIYKQESSIKQYTGADLIYKVPKNWSIYLEISPKSDSGYIESLNAFILEKVGQKILNIQIIGEDKPLFAENVDIKQIRVKGNIVACRTTNRAFVYDVKAGKIILGEGHFNREQIAKDDADIDKILRVLDDNTIIVSSKYDSSNEGGKNKDYASIYRPTYTGEQKNRGTLVARILRYGEKLDDIQVFDSRYIVGKDRVNTSTTNECYRIYNLSSTKFGAYNDGDKVYENKSDSSFKYDLTYIGLGRFYYFEQWTTTGEKYDMTIGTTKYNFTRDIYIADLDKTYPLTGNRVIGGLTNKYYDSSKINLDSKSFLNGNRMYASACYNIDSKKEGHYDQYILDQDMNIIYSLSGDIGRELTQLKEGNISMFELILDFVDGYGYAPIGPGVLNIYDTNGKIITEYKDPNDATVNYPIVTAQLNNGLMIVEKDIKNNNRLGIVDVKTGKQLAPYEFEYIVPFVCDMTFAKKPGESWKVIGRDGEEMLDDRQEPIIKNIVHAGTNQYKGTEMLTLGVFIAEAGQKGSGNYEVRRLTTDTDNAVILSKKAKSCSLYPYDARTTFVIFKPDKLDGNYDYEVYKLK